MVTALDKNTALVLVDLQKGILQNPALARTVKGVLKNASRLVEAFRREELPVVFVNVNAAGAPWTTSRKDAKPSQAAAPADAHEIAEELNPHPGDIFITKHTWGAFFETKLDEELRKRNITGIVLGGVSTSIGVEGTARGASERAYNITFASDAMADSVQESGEKSLKYIFPRIGEVDTTDNILEKLAGERV